MYGLYHIWVFRKKASVLGLSMKQAELTSQTLSEDKMASFKLNLKIRFDTTSTVIILTFVVVLLVAWKYRKSIKQLYSRFKILPQMCDRSRKRVPEEHEDNYSEVLFSFDLRFLA